MGGSPRHERRCLGAGEELPPGSAYRLVKEIEAVAPLTPSVYLSNARNVSPSRNQKLSFWTAPVSDSPLPPPLLRGVSCPEPGATRHPPQTAADKQRRSLLLLREGQQQGGSPRKGPPPLKRVFSDPTAAHRAQLHSLNQAL